MQTKPILILITITVLVLFGCIEMKNGIQNSADSVQRQATSKRDLKNGCELFEIADLEGLLGAHFSIVGNTVFTQSDDLYERSTCSVKANDGKRQVLVSAYVSNNLSIAKSLFDGGRKVVDSGKIGAEVQSHALVGLGDQAYFYGYPVGPGYYEKNVTVVVLNGRKMIGISFWNVPEVNETISDKVPLFVNQLFAKI